MIHRASPVPPFATEGDRLDTYLNKIARELVISHGQLRDV
jgi:hypothetical protein